jgi:hypothetical protein
MNRADESKLEAPDQLIEGPLTAQLEKLLHDPVLRRRSAKAAAERVATLTLDNRPETWMLLLADARARAH